MVLAEAAKEKLPERWIVIREAMFFFTAHGLEFMACMLPLLLLSSTSLFLMVMMAGHIVIRSRRWRGGPQHSQRGSSQLLE